MADCFNFLRNNPSEVIIMQLNEENGENTRSFGDTCFEYINKNPKGWFLEDRIPSLGEVRGKIVLIRRFRSVKINGIDATDWADNTTFIIRGRTYNIRIQDNYKVEDYAAKERFKKLLDEAKSSDRNCLYINFSSGYHTNFLGIPNIPAVSNRMNPKVIDYCKKAKYKSRLGIIPMDFVTKELSSSIVETNLPLR